MSDAEIVKPAASPKKRKARGSVAPRVRTPKQPGEGPPPPKVKKAKPAKVLILTCPICEQQVPRYEVIEHAKAHCIDVNEALDD